MSKKRANAEELVGILFYAGYTSLRSIPSDWTDSEIDDWLGNLGYEWIEGLGRYAVEISMN